MTFRQLTEEQDFSETRRVFLEAFSKAPWNDDWSDGKQLDSYIHDLLSPNNALCFGLFDEDSLVGLVLGRHVHFYTGDQFRIDELCIDPRFQHKGYGHLLLEEVEKACRRRNIQSLFLVTERDFPAYLFYRKNGFSPADGSVSLFKEIPILPNDGEED